MRQEELIAERCGLAMARIREIPGESICGEAYQDYFWQMAKFVSLMDQTYTLVEDGTLRRMGLEELKEHNHALYADILPENYGESYANPDYATDRLGKSIGQCLSFLYTELRAMIPAAYEQNRVSLTVKAELLLEVYQLFVCAAQEEREPDAEELRESLYWYVSDYYEAEFEEKSMTLLDADRDFAHRIIMESDLSDLRYLYYFGEYVTENERKTAAHLNGMSPEKIKLMADTYTEGYRIGFEVTNKDISIKETVTIRYFL